MTCSCEGSPLGSSWLWPEQAPGRPGHFLQLALHLVDLLSSVFLLPLWSYIPACQTSHKGFPVCRTEEEAVGPFLSVLLGGCPAVCTQPKQRWVQCLRRAWLLWVFFCCFSGVAPLLLPGFCESVLRGELASCCGELQWPRRRWVLHAEMVSLLLFIQVKGEKAQLMGLRSASMWPCPLASRSRAFNVCEKRRMLNSWLKIAPSLPCSRVFHSWGAG